MRDVGFSLLARALPGIDRERVWQRLDLQAPASGEILLETQLVRQLKPWRRAIATVVLAFFLAGAALVWGAGPVLFTAFPAEVAPLVPLLLGVLVHGLFVLVVHDCTHGNLFGRPQDDWIGNGAIGVLLLPFLAERYQMAHHLHHRRANQAGDTNWTPFRQRLFCRSRLLYVLYELIPVVNNFDRIREGVAPAMRSRMLFAWLCGVATWAMFEPPLLYWVLVVVGLNTINALRLWVEHFGHYSGRISNTYYCPLGFGIGNHEVHHRFPRLPAPVLAVGLMLRRKDASILSGIGSLLLDDGYAHFRTYQEDFTGDNV